MFRSTIPPPSSQRHPLQHDDGGDMVLRQNPEDHDLNFHRRENLKSRKCVYFKFNIRNPAKKLLRLLTLHSLGRLSGWLG